MNNIVSVASFNTSFASDLNLRLSVFSEANFQTTCNERECFEKSIETVCYFLQNETNPVIGLQEINDTRYISAKDITYPPKIYDIKGSDFDIKGSDYICKKIKESVSKKITAVVAGVQGASDTFPALMIAYDSDFFGDCNSNNVEIVDLLQTPQIDGKTIKGFPQKGRPIMFVYTDKGFLFINLHAANKGELLASGDLLKETLIDKIQTYYKKFIKDKKISPHKTFIMGDLNDPYNTITEITLDGNTFKYKGKAPISCCYNVNSSCKERQFKENGNFTIELENGFVDGKMTYIEKSLNRIPERLECTTKSRKTGDPSGDRGKAPNFLNLTNKPEDIGDEGKIENYKFTGDYVFGASPKTDLKMYHDKGDKSNKLDEVSTRSDHEMVYSIFLTGMPAIFAKKSTSKRGGRKLHKKRASHKKPKSRKTRKHKRH